MRETEEMMGVDTEGKQSFKYCFSQRAQEHVIAKYSDSTQAVVTLSY